MGRNPSSEKLQCLIGFLESLPEQSPQFSQVEASALGEALTAITEDAAAFCRFCPNLLPASVCFDINDDRFTPLGQALLDFSPKIRKLRFELVRARRLSENEFFCRLLCGLNEQLQVGMAVKDVSDGSCNSLASLNGPQPPAAEEAEDVEYTLLNIPGSTAFRVSSASYYRSEDWSETIWSGRCRVLAKGANLTIKLVDARSDEVFAQCIVQNGDHETVVENAEDSNRFFVLKISNGSFDTFLGLGFDCQVNASDFKSCLHEFKARFGQLEIAQDVSSPSIESPKHGFSMKEGQTITVSLKNKVGSRAKNGHAVQESECPPSISLLLAPPPPPGPASLAPQPNEHGIYDVDLDDGDLDFGDFQGAEPTSNDDFAGIDPVESVEERERDGGEMISEERANISGLQEPSIASEDIVHVQKTAVDGDIASKCDLQRWTLNLQAGQADSSKIPWCVSAGSVAPWSLRWKVVVLSELTVDLKIHAVLRESKSEQPSQEIVLQKHARGDSFVGSFAPARDRRVQRTTTSNGDDAHNIEVKEIVFSFSNAFSWFKPKDVELILVFDSER